MGSVNSYNPKIDPTVRIFDDFYLYSANVPSQEYDAVFSYLRSQFDSVDAAGNFAVTMFRISEQSEIPVMTLLQQIQGLNQLELTLTFSYYLNGLRSSSTLLGLNQPVTPNYYVARNIRT
jgi:hypothetical protein